MKKNMVFVHVLAFFMLGYSSAFGQQQSQQNAASKQVAETPVHAGESDKLTSVAKKYLKKMEKSRNHHLREQIKAKHLSTKGKSQHLTSNKGNKKSPQHREDPKLALDKPKDQEVVKK